MKGLFWREAQDHKQNSATLNVVDHHRNSRSRSVRHFNVFSRSDCKSSHYCMSVAASASLFDAAVLGAQTSSEAQHVCVRC